MLELYGLVFRLGALLIVPMFLVDFEIYLLFQVGLFLHISSGLNSIINDYIHVKKIWLIFFFLIRISTIEAIRCSLELLL